MVFVYCISRRWWCLHLISVSYEPKRLKSTGDYVKIKVQMCFKKSNNGTRHSRISLITAQRDTEKGKPNQWKPQRNGKVRKLFSLSLVREIPEYCGLVNKCMAVLSRFLPFPLKWLCSMILQVTEWLRCLHQCWRHETYFHSFIGSWIGEIRFFKAKSDYTDRKTEPDTRPDKLTELQSN